jgi:hypothetical protein
MLDLFTNIVKENCDKNIESIFFLDLFLSILKSLPYIGKEKRKESLKNSIR